MEKEEQDNLKTVITERFITAVDYLVDSGRVDSIADFERMTGIRAQRITGMKGYLEGKSGNSQYAGIHQIKIVNELYHVSLDYIFNGIKPIVVDKSDLAVAEKPVTEYSRDSLEMKEQLRLMQQKMELLNEKVEFYKEVAASRKP